MAIAAVDQAGKVCTDSPGPALSSRPLGATAATESQRLCRGALGCAKAQRVQAMREAAALMPWWLDRQPWPDVRIEQVQARAAEGLREQGAFRPALDQKQPPASGSGSASRQPSRRQLWPDRFGHCLAWQRLLTAGRAAASRNAKPE